MGNYDLCGENASVSRDELPTFLQEWVSTEYVNEENGWDSWHPLQELW